MMNRINALKKKIFPAGLRSALYDTWRTYLLNRTLRSLASSTKEQPDHQVLQRLCEGWGNESYTAHVEYLEAVVRAASMTPGPILECGSGLTTLLLGLFAGGRGVKIWTLEHDPKWYERMGAALQRYEISGVELCLTPLRNYGDFSWYCPPFDRMPKNFSLVVCDGPPKKTTPGDRYGLLPVMGERLRSGAVILLDDVKVSIPDDVLTRWKKERSSQVEIFQNTLQNSFARFLLG